MIYCNLCSSTILNLLSAENQLFIQDIHFSNPWALPPGVAAPFPPTPHSYTTAYRCDGNNVNSMAMISEPFRFSHSDYEDCYAI